MTHTTNYENAFIAVAEDCPVSEASIPPAKSPPTVAELQYERLVGHPFEITSDDLLFAVHAARNEGASREEFFSKGQACLRGSPLAKRYGWGFRFDADGRVAMLALGSPEYAEALNDPNLKHVQAMRSKR